MLLQFTPDSTNGFLAEFSKLFLKNASTNLWLSTCSRQLTLGPHAPGRGTLGGGCGCGTRPRTQWPATTRCSSRGPCPAPRSAWGWVPHGGGGEPAWGWAGGETFRCSSCLIHVLEDAAFQGGAKFDLLNSQTFFLLACFKSLVFMCTSASI